MDIAHLLRTCTVRVRSGKGSGTAFFVMPNLLATCSHILEYKTGVTFTWNDAEQEGLIVEYSDEQFPDIALIETKINSTTHTYLNADVRIGDPLYSFGYTDLYPMGDSLTANYEGETFANANIVMLKFKGGQVRPGMSGAPLLNLRTGGVCGIIKRTRDKTNELGGRAISARFTINLLHKRDCTPQRNTDIFHGWKQAMLTEDDLLLIRNLVIRSHQSIPSARRAFCRRLGMKNIDSLEFMNAPSDLIFVDDLVDYLYSGANYPILRKLCDEVSHNLGEPHMSELMKLKARILSLENDWSST